MTEHGSRARDNKVGYSGRRVGKQIMRHSTNTAELLYIIADDIADGDNDFRRAHKAMNELTRSNLHLSDVGAGLVEGRLDVAEHSAALMLGEGKGVTL